MWDAISTNGFVAQIVTPAGLLVAGPTIIVAAFVLYGLQKAKTAVGKLAVVLIPIALLYLYVSIILSLASHSL